MTLTVCLTVFAAVVAVVMSLCITKLRSLEVRTHGLSTALHDHVRDHALSAVRAVTVPRAPAGNRPPPIFDPEEQWEAPIAIVGGHLSDASGRRYQVTSVDDFPDGTAITAVPVTPGEFPRPRTQETPKGVWDRLNDESKD